MTISATARPSCLLFDLDGTLFDRDAAIPEVLRDQYRRAGAVLAAVPEDRYVARVLELDNHGHSNKPALFKRLASELGLPLSVEPKLTQDFWGAYHAHGRCFPDATSTLIELQSRGFSLGIITNGREMVQEPTIRRLGLDTLVDVVLVSEREGLQKPDRAIFDRALRALDVRTSAAWFVGDHPRIDVEGAVGAGLTGVWRRTPYWPVPSARHLRIDSLKELLAMVEADPAALEGHPK